jgi:hypothetical protein
LAGISEDRAQILLESRPLDELPAEDHPARIVWAVVERWNPGKFLDAVKARGETPRCGPHI